MQAYTTSPACGTSQFSAYTGKYPSNKSNSGVHNFTTAQMMIPCTKFKDIEGYGNDWQDNSVMAAMTNAGYCTGVVGKWFVQSQHNNIL